MRNYDTGVDLAALMAPEVEHDEELFDWRSIGSWLVLVAAGTVGALLFVALDHYIRVKTGYSIR